MGDLNPKQKRFVAEYLIDLNATQAYIRAGYSKGGASQAAEKLLRNTEVRAAITAAQAKIANRLEITAEKVLTDLETARLGALGESQYSAAIRASELQGKSLPGGLFTDKQSTTTKSEDEKPVTVLEAAREIAFALQVAMREAAAPKSEPSDTPLKH